MDNSRNSVNLRIIYVLYIEEINLKTEPTHTAMTSEAKRPITGYQPVSYYSAYDAHLATAPQHIPPHNAHLATAPQHMPTQHDMLPQHLVCKYELNFEYCNITLARNKDP